MDHSNPQAAPTLADSGVAVSACSSASRSSSAGAVVPRSGLAVAADRPSSIARSARRAPTRRSSVGRSRGVTLAVDSQGLERTSARRRSALGSRRRRQRQTGSATQRRHAHHELRQRVDPVRDQPGRAVPDRRPAVRERAPGAGSSTRRAAPRTSTRTARSASRAPAGSQASTSSRSRSSTERPRHHTRRVCAGRSSERRSGWTLGLRLDDRTLPVPYLIDPIALIAACALPAGPGGTTSCTAARSTGSSSLGITKPSAAVSGDTLVAQLTVRSTGAITPPAGWSQIGATAQDAGRADRAGGLLASRRRHGVVDDHVLVGGRQRRRLRRARHVQGRRSVHRLRPGRKRHDLAGERRHRRDRQSGRPRRHDLGGERDASGRLRRRERRHRHADGGPGSRPRVDRRLDRWRRRSQRASRTASRLRPARRGTRPPRG